MARNHDMDQAALMDDVYAFQRHVYDLTRPFFLFGRDRPIRDLDAPPGTTILEVGCGTARNLTTAARMWPGTRLHGLDVSPAMLETARASVERQDLSNRISLAQGDAGTLDVTATFGLPAVDRIIFSYTLSMMPPWREALARAAAALAPGGSIHVLDFGRYGRLPDAMRRVHWWSLGTCHVFPREDMQAVLAEVAGVAGLEMEFREIMRGYSCMAVLRRPARGRERTE